MIASRVLTGFLLLVLCFGCRSTDKRGGTDPKVGLPTLMSVLSKAQLSGSLEYWGVCDVNRRIDLPKMRLPHKGEGGSSPVQVLRQIFADDAQMQVTQDPTGMIRMIESGVPRDLLDFRINHVSFKLVSPDGDVVYQPRVALQAIVWAPEVQAFMKTHDIRQTVDFERAGAWPSLPPNAPHISGGLENVTVSQALDQVVQTFPGLWIYENCSSKKGKRTVDFGIHQNSSEWAAMEKDLIK